MAGTGRFAGAAEPIPFEPGRLIEGIVNAEMWARRAEYRGAFPAAGRVIAEVTGLPADCAVQIGSQGFAATEDSPVDWSDGEPGKPARHVFTVEPGRPGKVWVMIRTRAASVSMGDWTGVSCSVAGPWYTLPADAAGAKKGPADFEGRPVRPPISFGLRVGSERDMTATTTAPASNPASPTSASARAGAGNFWFDAALGFGFEMPPGWSVESPDATTRRVRAPAGSPVQAIKLEVRVLSDANAAPGLQLNRMHEERTKVGAELHVMGPLTVAGTPAMFAAHVLPAPEGRAEPAERRYADIAVGNAQRCYLIAFEGRHNLFEEATPLYRQVVGSFSFTDPRSTPRKDSAP